MEQHREIIGNAKNKVDIDKPAPLNAELVFFVVVLLSEFVLS